MARLDRSAPPTLRGKLRDVVNCRRGATAYVRLRVTPANPRSEAQQEHRSTFAQAVAAWKELTDAEREEYRERARRQGRTGYNLYLAEYLARVAAVDPPNLGKVQPHGQDR